MASPCARVHHIMVMGHRKKTGQEKKVNKRTVVRAHHEMDDRSPSREWLDPAYEPWHEPTYINQKKKKKR